EVRIENEERRQPIISEFFIRTSNFELHCYVHVTPPSDPRRSKFPSHRCLPRPLVDRSRDVLGEQCYCSLCKGRKKVELDAADCACLRSRHGRQLSPSSTGR